MNKTYIDNGLGLIVTKFTKIMPSSDQRKIHNPIYIIPIFDCDIFILNSNQLFVF